MGQDAGMSRSHAELQELVSGYVLDILEPDERRTFDAHLYKCAECTAEVSSLRTAAHALARSLPERAPPLELRERVLASARGAERPPGTALSPTSWADRRLWLPGAAVILIALGTGIYGSHIHVETRLAALAERAEVSDREVAAAARVATEARRAMEIVAAPDAIRFDLQGQGTAARAAGRAWWSPQHGVVFTGTNLPGPPPGMCHQLWMLTVGRSQSLGTLPQSGDGLSVFDPPLQIPPSATLVLTVEPTGGSPAPSGPSILAGVAQQGR